MVLSEERCTLLHSFTVSFATIPRKSLYAISMYPHDLDSIHFQKILEKKPEVFQVKPGTFVESKVLEILNRLEEQKVKVISVNYRIEESFRHLWYVIYRR